MTMWNLKNIMQKEILLDGFEKVAIKYGNLNANNINLGWINSSSLSNDINKILNEMKIGEVSSPIIKQNSIIFLKINDTRKSNVRKDNLIKIKNDLINQEKNEQFKLYSKVIYQN